LYRFQSPARRNLCLLVAWALSLLQSDPGLTNSINELESPLSLVSSGRAVKVGGTPGASLPPQQKPFARL
jgi:hypothetical protein